MRLTELVALRTPEESYEIIDVSGARAVRLWPLSSSSTTPPLSSKAAQSTLMLYLIAVCVALTLMV